MGGRRDCRCRVWTSYADSELFQTRSPRRNVIDYQLEMLTPRVEAGQKPARPGCDVSCLIILTGKGADRIDRLEAGNRGELYFRADLATHDPGAAVTGNRVNGRQESGLQEFRVTVRGRFAIRPATPDSCNHRGSSVTHPPIELQRHPAPSPTPESAPHLPP